MTDDTNGMIVEGLSRDRPASRIHKGLPGGPSRANSPELPGDWEDQPRRGTTGTLPRHILLERMRLLHDAGDEELYA
jgi:hypothetical protein